MSHNVYTGFLMDILEHLRGAFEMLFIKIDILDPGLWLD